jgi:hypothetical protein
MLPDVALLAIFDCYMDQEEDSTEADTAKAWHTLVHVCQKWRNVVFGSPRRLNLRLFCGSNTPVRETLAVCPPLPIVIGLLGDSRQPDNIIAALEHNDRVCQIDMISVGSRQLEEVLTAMQTPFTALTRLIILWEKFMRQTPPVVPDLFLGGSAPRLQHLELISVPFPALPKLLLTATDLVSLSLLKIPHSGYISPEAMVRCLSTLTRLESLDLEFESPLSRPVRASRRPPLPTRQALHALTHFSFEGVSEYLEDLVARIDAPLLNSLCITFFHQLIFDTPQLTQFVARTSNIQPLVEARIEFSDRYLEFISPQTISRWFVLRIICTQSDWQLSSLAQVCSSSFPALTVERIYICNNGSIPPDWQDDIEGSQWLEVLHPFVALKDLHVSRKFVPRIAPAFQELAGERVTEMLPALQSLSLEELHPSGPVREAIEKLAVARRLAGYPLDVSYSDGNQN